MTVGYDRAFLSNFKFECAFVQKPHQNKPDTAKEGRRVDEKREVSKGSYSAIPFFCLSDCQTKQRYMGFGLFIGVLSIQERTVSLLGSLVLSVPSAHGAVPDLITDQLCSKTIVY